MTTGSDGKAFGVGFSPAVSVYSSLRAALKISEGHGKAEWSALIQDAMAYVWEAMSEADQKRWFQGER